MTRITITIDAVVNYSQCPRKAFLYLFDQEQGNPNEYVQALERARISNRAKHIAFSREQSTSAELFTNNELSKGSEVLIEANLQIEDLKAYSDILTRVATSPLEYQPTIISGTYSVTREQRLELSFIGYVLGKIQGKLPRKGSIIDAGGNAHHLKLDNQKVVKQIIDTLRKWIESPTVEAPPTSLNKHCPYCQFQALCKSKAEQDDDLSLLDRLTPKLVRRYHEKGIFTVKQLSYTFRPRRNRKQRKKKTGVLYKPELHALAIRTGKIYLQEIPELDRRTVELFLDIEGLPDRKFHYLIGLLVRDGEDCSHYSFWAETQQDEEYIWQQFLAKVEEYPDAPIYHYGSYEPKAIRQLTARYKVGADSLIKRLTNLNGCIYGKVYFPVRSNRLKEIGQYIGASWTALNASGLQSLAWRHFWEETQDNVYKQKLILYNAEDCEALRLLVNKLCEIKMTADSASDIDYANHPKQYATDVGKDIHIQLETILKFAHAGYDKKKIEFRPKEKGEHKKRGAVKGHTAYQRIVPQAQDVINLPPRNKCPKCENLTLQPSQKIVERTVVDFIFLENSCTKTITKYVGTRGYCPKCKRYYEPDDLDKYGEPIFGQGFQSLFGRGFQSWVIYERLALRLPYDGIVQSLEEQFGERINKSTIVNMVKHFAAYYSNTEQLLLQSILESPFVHTDETKINIEGTDHYLWVFTDGLRVIFRFTDTREATIAHEILEGYNGVVVSDFYGGYDSIECRQQKCLVHLIRDLNDDLWKSPFDSEFELFVLEAKKLFVPILEAVSEYGLRIEHLGKFRKNVDQFYEIVIDNHEYYSELVLKYQKRFRRYRQSLFTFLEFDSIPWNNNEAERALRHVIVQESISKTFYMSVIKQYSVLLGVMQTCRFQEKSFLKFLLSGEANIDIFKETSRIISSRAVGSLAT